MPTEESKRPGYYVRKRLLSNIPAMAGLVFILITLVIAILGYTIMPDDTPNANDGAVQIQKELPGFKVKMLKIRKPLEITGVSWIRYVLFGQESVYTLIPISAYEVDGTMVRYLEYSKKEKTLKGPQSTIDLITSVCPVFLGDSRLFKASNGLNYYIKGDTVHYLDLNERIVTRTLASVKNEFISQNIEERTYFLGTDKAGRDILSRLLFGARISLAIGFIAVLISLLVGGVLGAVAGYFGGWIDNVVQWLMTVVWSIPSIMLVIAISLALGSKGIWVAFLAVGLTTWVEIARVIRGEIMAIKEKTYIEAARALGLKNYSIIVRHMLPNLLGAIIVISTSNFASAILIEAGLSFLGLGVQPPMPSWGMMVNEGFQSIGTKNSWHLVVFPSVLISLLVLAFNLFGNGLRDAYDPQGSNKL
jgi:peptide/nickel transport system permease protein